MKVGWIQPRFCRGILSKFRNAHSIAHLILALCPVIKFGNNPSHSLVNADMTVLMSSLTELAVANGERLSWGKRTYIMGVINVTPDSFSGDGLGGDVRAAVEQALRFEGEGADFLDIGAESTRPGHRPVAEAQELARLLPSLEAVAARVSIPISVDTSKSGVARAALDAGACIINDIWGLKSDPSIAVVAAERGAGLVLMHNQHGHRYDNLLDDITSSLNQSFETALAASVSSANMVVDPGMGFGKTADQNIEVLRNLGRIKELGLPLLVGTSRKSTIGLLLGGLPPDQRMEGTAATVVLAIASGADIVRVHDVREMARVCRVSDAIVRGWRPDGWEATT